MEWHSHSPQPHLQRSFRRRQLDADLEEELRAHIDLAIAENQNAA